MSDSATESRRPNWLVICRAADSRRDGANAEARLSLIQEPTEEDLERLRDAIADTYRHGFGRKPERVGVAVLPWVDDIDDPDDDA